jgi:hypothetical protein
MAAPSDTIQLSAGVQAWPIEIAEQLLASPLPWGPPNYALGVGYIDDPRLPDHASEFIKLAHCVDGAYQRHEKAQEWARATSQKHQATGTWQTVSTQDLLDILFLYARGERFTDGLIRSVEPALRAILQEVVKRVHTNNPPTFLPG